MLNADPISIACQTESHTFGHSDLETRSVHELEEEIVELCVHMDAATYRLLRAIAEFDRREAWGVGFNSTAHWLTWRVGIDRVTAREKVRVARALEGLPKISESFRQGKVSYSKVRAMTRIGRPDNEDYLLFIAENGTATHVERLVRSYVRAVGGEDQEEARRQRQERYLEMYTDDDGMVVVRGRLPQEVAALLEKALEAAMDALKEEAKSEEPKKGERNEVVHSDGGPGCTASAEAPDGCERTDPNDSGEAARPSVGSAVRASAEASQQEKPRHTRASAQSCRTSLIPAEEPRIATDPSGASAEAPRRSIHVRHEGIPAGEAIRAGHASAEACPRETLAQKRVDALGLLAEAALGKGLGQTERGEPYQVMIHVDSAVLADESADGRCELEGGEGISVESCRRLVCDAPHVTVVEDTEGNVLRMGRKARKISKPLWRALMSRDRTCRFPGCTRTRHLQAHHIEHWAQGGETNPGNLLLVCRAHHWALHEGGVRVEGRSPHGLVFLRSDGRVLPGCPVRAPINGEAGESLKEANRRQGLEITAKTVDSFWDGESMDVHMAVDALLTYDDDRTDEERFKEGILALSRA